VLLRLNWVVLKLQRINLFKKELLMAKFTFDLPFLFGDHHVIEVRRLLKEVPGVSDMYVSSSFHTVEVTYDPDATNPEKITASLEEAGYLGDTLVPEEVAVLSSSERMNSPYFRKTDIYETTRKITSFRQTLSVLNRHVWPCPGFGALISVKRTK
jgi:copper chaperone CopZ